MSEIPSPRLRLRDPSVYIPLLIFLGALAFRLIGIGWGLANPLHNQSYHPDEIPIWAAAQRIEPAHFKFMPGFYNYGTLYLTLLRIAGDVAGLRGGPVDPNDAGAFWSYVSLCHLMGRLISAAAGAAMASALFSMMKRWTSRFGAVCAGLLIAVAPAHVVHSRFQTVDILAASLLTFSALFALKIVPSPVDDSTSDDGFDPNQNSKIQDPKWAILSGLFAGLSAGTKYTGILGLLTLWTALGVARPKGWVGMGLRGTAASLIAFAIVAPGIVLDNARFMRDFGYEMLHTQTGHGLEFAHTMSGYLYHLSNLFAGIGLFMTLLALSALVCAAVLKKPWALVLLAFFIPYCMIIGGSEVKFLRYTFPLYIAIAAGFGWAMGAANRRRGKHFIAVFVGIFGLAGLDTGGFRWAAIDTYRMASQDARDAAGAHLRDPKVGKGRTVGLVSDPWYWTPAVYGDTSMPRSAGKEIFAPMLAAHDPRVIRTMPPSIDQWDARLLTDLRPDYVAFSNYEVVNYERMKLSGSLSPLEKLQVDRFTDFAGKLMKGYTLERAYGIGTGNPAAEVPDMMYVLPEIWVWKRNDLH